LKTLADPRIVELCTPIIYGSPKAAGYYRNTLREVENVPLNTISDAAHARAGKVNIVPIGEGEIKIEPGIATPTSGKAAVDALRRAVEELKAGEIDALVTAPINKEAVQGEDFHFTGHTEFLASELEGEPLMMMCSERLRVGLVTIHIPVSEISSALTQEKIVERLTQLRGLLKQDFGIVEQFGQRVAPRFYFWYINGRLNNYFTIRRNYHESYREKERCRAAAPWSFYAEDRWQG
jgi:4-hydroxythreonine-4-phosphate dehydrogenase